MVQKYEIGATDPTSYTIALLADRLGVTADYLLGMTDDPQINVRENSLNETERQLVETFRRQGWGGVAQLSVGELVKEVPAKKTSE